MYPLSQVLQLQVWSTTPSSDWGSNPAPGLTLFLLRVACKQHCITEGTQMREQGNKPKGNFDLDSDEERWWLGTESMPSTVLGTQLKTEWPSSSCHKLSQTSKVSLFKAQIKARTPQQTLLWINYGLTKIFSTQEGRNLTGAYNKGFSTFLKFQLLWRHKSWWKYEPPTAFKSPWHL